LLFYCCSVYTPVCYVYTGYRTFGLRLVGYHTLPSLVTFSCVGWLLHCTTVGCYTHYVVTVATHTHTRLRLVVTFTVVPRLPFTFTRLICLDYVYRTLRYGFVWLPHVYVTRFVYGCTLHTVTVTVYFGSVTVYVAPHRDGYAFTRLRTHAHVRLPRYAAVVYCTHTLHVWLRTRLPARLPVVVPPHARLHFTCYTVVTPHVYGWVGYGYGCITFVPHTFYTRTAAGWLFAFTVGLDLHTRLVTVTHIYGCYGYVTFLVYALFPLPGYTFAVGFTVGCRLDVYVLHTRYVALPHTHVTHLVTVYTFATTHVRLVTHVCPAHTVVVTGLRYPLYTFTRFVYLPTVDYVCSLPHVYGYILRWFPHTCLAVYGCYARYVTVTHARTAFVYVYTLLHVCCVYVLRLRYILRYVWLLRYTRLLPVTRYVHRVGCYVTFYYTFTFVVAFATLPAVYFAVTRTRYGCCWLLICYYGLVTRSAVARSLPHVVPHTVCLPRYVVDWITFRLRVYTLPFTRYTFTVCVHIYVGCYRILFYTLLPHALRATGCWITLRLLLRWLHV